MPRRKPLIPKERPTRPTLCVICGVAASGYNYGAPSCLSCKAFFRRALIKNRIFGGCSRHGLCSAESHRPCRSCRFERCIKGGMNALLVFRRNTSDSTTEEKQTVEFPVEELPIIRNPFRFEDKLEKLMQYLIYIEEAHQLIRMSTFTPKHLPGLSIDDFLHGPSKLGGKFKPMCVRPYEPLAMGLMPVELIIKNRFVMDLTNFDYSAKKLWHFQDVVYSMEFIKALDIYRHLSDSSKRILIASALACSNFSAAFYSFAHQSDRPCYPDGSVTTWSKDTLAQCPGSTRFYTVLIAAMKEADLDAREYTLLRMIVICNPLLEGLHSYDVSLLQREQERFTKILLSYVLARRGVEKGPAHFAKLLFIVNLSTKLTGWLKKQCILILALGLFKNSSLFSEQIYHSS